LATARRGVKELAGVKLREAGWHEGIGTIGGLIPAILGRFPEVGEEVRVGGVRLRVESRDGLRVATARLLPR
jgi:CBS domain containing-hemolysin-like protein